MLAKHVRRVGIAVPCLDLVLVTAAHALAAFTARLTMMPIDEVNRHAGRRRIGHSKALSPGGDLH